MSAAFVLNSATPQDRPGLEVQELRFAYNGAPVLVDINLRVSEGEFVACSDQVDAARPRCCACSRGLTFQPQVRFAGRAPPFTVHRSIGALCFRTIHSFHGLRSRRTSNSPYRSRTHNMTNTGGAITPRITWPE
jgi:hypothetical protein